MEIIKDINETNGTVLNNGLGDQIIQQEEFSLLKLILIAFLSGVIVFFVHSCMKAMNSCNNDLYTKKMKEQMKNKLNTNNTNSNNNGKTKKRE